MRITHGAPALLGGEQPVAGRAGKIQGSPGGGGGATSPAESGRYEDRFETSTSQLQSLRDPVATDGDRRTRRGQAPNGGKVGGSLDRF
jgi:hypothetical protein